MSFRVPSRPTAHAALRAMLTVAAADGSVTDNARQLMRSGQQWLLGTDFDLDALEPISAAELAREVSDRHDRDRIVGACLLVTMIDERPTPAQLRQVERYADALGLGQEELQTVRKLQEGRVLQFQVDAVRRFYTERKLKETVAAKGLTGLASELARRLLHLEAPAIAARYQALRALPDGTLGREYARFIDDHGFSFPGELGGPPEAFLFHDCLHVLTGYGTTFAEEARIIGFQAGCQNQDAFYTLMGIIAHIQLGVRVTDFAPTPEEGIDVDAVVQAFQRGSQLNTDLTEGWDAWAVIDQPVEALRARYNIAPRA